ncbi:c-type cytochrome [Sphingomonas sp.]|uniref:c-type cytochrome n=1 Tax=Sphingomonas sp. TaxID=28214 RepID=UPI003D6CDD7B
MRGGTIAIFGATLVLAATTGANAGGQTAPAASTPPAAASVPVDPGAIVAGRKAAFLLSAASFGGMKAVIDSGGDVAGQAFAARSLANWAKALPAMFPPGSNVAPTEALPNVWTDRAGFDAKAAAYAEAAGKLAALAKAGDKPGFAAQWGEVRKTCGGCHEVYRKEDKKG